MIRASGQQYLMLPPINFSLNYRRDDMDSFHQSGPVIGIDFYIIVGQVRSPDCCLRITTAESDPDGDFFFLHFGRARRFGITCSNPALLSNQHMIEINRHALHRQIRYRSSPDCRQDSPPVRVTSKQRSFDQRRMGNGIGDFPGFVCRSGLLNLNRNKFSGTFTVTDDGMR